MTLSHSFNITVLALVFTVTDINGLYNMQEVKMLSKDNIYQLISMKYGTQKKMYDKGCSNYANYPWNKP